MNSNNGLDADLLKKLAALSDVPARDPVKARAGREAFLQAAQNMASAVTPPKKQRHSGWMHAFQTIFSVHPKEHSPMFSTLATLIVIASLLLGGGVTVVAAQGSQPDQPLYGLKVFSENVRLDLTSDPQTKYQLALEFTNRRAVEFEKMLQAGGVPPPAVQTRYQSQVELAIQSGLNLPDQQAVQALERIRAGLQHQMQIMPDSGSTPRAEAILHQTRQMLQERLQWVEQGLQNPASLRNLLRQREQQRNQNRQPTTGGAPTGTGDGNPWSTGTPTPCSGFGPGTCAPSGERQGGGNPWVTGTPTPGSGNGPGPGPDPSQTCTPGSGGTPQSTQQRKNQPTEVPQSTESGTGSKPTTAPGGPGGKK